MKNWVAWSAGIIEGEGCLGLYKDKRRANTFTLKIQVESTDKFVVDKLQEIYGGSVYENNAPSKLPKYKKSWRWLICNKKDVKNVLLCVIDYFSPRRLEKANEILQHINDRD